MVVGVVGLASPYSYLEMDALPGLVLPDRGRWCLAGMQPLALDACEDISCLRTCAWIFT
jgi:hypothetical protein